MITLKLIIVSMFGACLLESKASAVQIGFSPTHPKFQDGTDIIEDIELTQPTFISFLNAVDLGAINANRIRYQVFYDTNELSLDNIIPNSNDLRLSTWQQIGNGLIQINHLSKAPFVTGGIVLDEFTFSSIKGREVLDNNGEGDYRIFNFAWGGLGPIWVEEPFARDVIEVQEVQEVQEVPAPLGIFGLGAFAMYSRSLRKRLEKKRK
jgi:hypothetical protein